MNAYVYGEKKTYVALGYTSVIKQYMSVSQSPFDEHERRNYIFCFKT
jgi:hypothetical protein